MDEEIVELTDNEGNKKKYEILDVIVRDDENYAVMLPEDSEDEVEIFKVAELDKGAEYIEVTDENLADEIFDEFIKESDLEENE